MEHKKTIIYTRSFCGYCFNKHRTIMYHFPGLQQNTFIHTYIQTDIFVIYKTTLESLEFQL